MTKVRRELWWDTFIPFGIAALVSFTPWLWVRIVGSLLMAIQVVILVHYRYWSKQLIHHYDPSLFAEMESEKPHE